jgi:hypothetical protein
MARYSCSLNGECGIDGEFTSLATCRLHCRSRSNRDTEYLIYQHNPVAAMHLGPGDRIEIVRRLTGTSAPVSVSRRVLQLLDARDYFALREVPALAGYAQGHIDRLISERRAEIQHQAPLELLMAEFASYVVVFGNQVYIKVREGDGPRLGNPCSSYPLADLIHLYQDLQLQPLAVDVATMCQLIIDELTARGRIVYGSVPGMKRLVLRIGRGYWLWLSTGRCEFAATLVMETAERTPCKLAHVTQP